MDIHGVVQLTFWRCFAGLRTLTEQQKGRAAPRQSIHREPSARSFGVPQRSYGSTSELGTPLSVFICLLILLSRCALAILCAVSVFRCDNTQTLRPY
jgi:hypothetical protein